MVAGMLGCLEDRNPRKVKLVLALPLVAFLFLNYAWRVFPIIRSDDWTNSWGIISGMGNAACWMGMVLFGTISLIRYSPSFSVRLAPCLFLFHLVSLAIYGLHSAGLWKFWAYTDKPLGFLASHTAWLGWAAMSIPILWTWGTLKFKGWPVGRLLAVLPALLILTAYNSYIAVTALMMGFLWAAIKTRRPWVITGTLIASLSILVLFAQRYEASYFLYLVKLRLYTWLIGLKAILFNPFGLGWTPHAFEQFLGAHSTRQVIPHFASDLIKGIAENGWLAIPCVGWIAYKTKEIGTDALSISLLIACSFGLIQRSLSVSYFGILAWAIWVLWMIDQKEAQSV